MARESFRFGAGVLLAVIAGTAAICFSMMRPGEKANTPTPRQNARSSPPEPATSPPETTKVSAHQRSTPEVEPDLTEGMPLSNIPPSKRGINADGTLPIGLARQLGFDEEQTQRAQAEITRLRSKMEESVAARAYRDEQASKPDIGLDVYRIPALPDRGKAMLAEFEAKLVQIGGVAAAARLVEGLGIKGFGGYGRYDVVVTFSPDEERAEVGEPIQADYVLTDPENGVAVLKGNSTLGAFSEQFGGWTADARDHE